MARTDQKQVTEKTKSASEKPQKSKPTAKKLNRDSSQVEMKPAPEHKPVEQQPVKKVNLFSAREQEESATPEMIERIKQLERQIQQAEQAPELSFVEA